MNFDYDGLLTALQNRLSLLSNWRQTLYYGVYQRINEAVAYVLDKFVYLTEYLYRESHWTTALKRRSLLLKAKFLNYTAHRKIAPSGSLIITGDSTGFFNNYTYTGESVTVNKWDEFSNTDGDVTVFCTEDTEYATGAQTISQTLDSGAVVDESGGQVSFLISDTSAFTANDIVKITGSDNYNGYHTIDSVTASTKITVTATYVAETFDGTEIIVSGFTFVPVKQGTPKTYTYIATGDANETITIYADNIDNDEIEVFEVDGAGTVISQIDIIGVDTEDTEHFFINDTDNYYCKVENDYDFESVNFVFGDDIYTKQLVAGTIILIKYAITDGEDGNITNTSTVTNVVSTLLDSYGNETTLYVTNDEEIGDGSDTESLTSIQNNAPNLFSTGYRCGGYYDWVEVLENDNRIHKSKIWTTDDEADDTITSNQNKVYAVAISADGSELTETQKSDITVDYLKARKSPTEIISWQPLNTIIAMFKVTDAIITNVDKALVKTQIFNALDAEYGILNTDFKEEVRESNYVRIIDNLSNVYYHETDVYCCEQLNNNAKLNYPIAVYNSSASESADEINVVPDTLELWVQNYSDGEWSSSNRIAYDSGGVWVAESGYELTATNITYVTSEVSFNVSSGLVGTIDEDYKLFMSYQTYDGNQENQNTIRFPSYDFITDVDLDFIFTVDDDGNSTLTYRNLSS